MPSLAHPTMIPWITALGLIVGGQKQDCCNMGNLLSVTLCTIQTEEPCCVYKPKETHKLACSAGVLLPR